MIRIWQVKKEKLLEFGFLGYDEVSGPVVIDNYDMVYEFEMQSADEWHLDDLYDIFNMSKPNDFTGHSMSASDVVEVDGEFWYCDRIGWKKLDWEVK